MVRWTTFRPFAPAPGKSLSETVSALPPAGLGGKALVEFQIIGPLRRLPDALVDAVGIVADQDAPAPGLDSLENDSRCGRRRGRRFVAEAPRPLGYDLLDLFIRHPGGVDAHGLHLPPRLQDVVRAKPVGVGPAQH